MRVEPADQRERDIRQQQQSHNGKRQPQAGAENGGAEVKHAGRGIAWKRRGGRVRGKTHRERSDHFAVQAGSKEHQPRKELSDHGENACVGLRRRVNGHRKTEARLQADDLRAHLKCFSEERDEQPSRKSKHQFFDDRASQAQDARLQIVRNRPLI